jgi:hypothetical protein
MDGIETPENPWEKYDQILLFTMQARKPLGRSLKKIS